MALDAFSPLCGADTPLYAVSLFWRFKLAEGLAFRHYKFWSNYAMN